MSLTTTPVHVAKAIRTQFPTPPIDDEWLDGCTSWIQDDLNINPNTSFREFMKNVREQFLRSDLKDSTQASNGLPARLADFTGRLEPTTPVTVQLLAITEIGVSAFQLEQVRKAREERMQEGVGNVEGEEGDVEVEGEGPMPKYARGVLYFLLSDGQREFEAMEYGKLPDINLGSTKLGYSLPIQFQLKGTRFQRGMALLEPNTLVVHGEFIKDLDDLQAEKFKQSLAARLRISGDNTSGPQGPFASSSSIHTSRSPLRDIVRPPVPDMHTDDVEAHLTRRVPTKPNVSLPASSTVSNPAQRPTKPLPRRSAGRQSLEGIQDLDRQNTDQRTSSTAERANLTFVGAAGIRDPKSSYFDVQPVGTSSLDYSYEPTPRQSTEPTKRIAAANGTYLSLQKQRNAGDGSSDYDMSDDEAFADPEILRNLDKMEREAYASASQARPSSTMRAASSSSSKDPSTGKSPPMGSAFEMIDLTGEFDMEDDDKENAQVSTRHVRQRTADMNSRSSPFGSSGTPTLSQKTGKPVILAKRAEDVLELSDSD